MVGSHAHAPASSDADPATFAPPSSDQQPILPMPPASRSGRWPWLGGAAALVTTVLVVAGGGLGTHDPIATPAASETFTVQPLQVTVTGGFVGSGYRDVVKSFAKGNCRMIAVAADITDVADRYVSADQAFRLADVATTSSVCIDTPKTSTAPDVYRADGGSLTTLEPGVPTHALLVWWQPVSEPAPTTVSMVVSSLRWRQAYIQDWRYWTDETPRARVRVPLTGAPAR